MFQHCYLKVTFLNTQERLSGPGAENKEDMEWLLISISLTLSRPQYSHESYTHGRDITALAYTWTQEVFHHKLSNLKYEN